MILIDSSFFVSFFLYNDSNYQKATLLYLQTKDEQVTSEDIVKETITVVSQRRGKDASIYAFKKILADCKILPISSERFEAGLKLFLNSKLQKDISLIDCITVAVCKELKIRSIFSFDRHFKYFGLKTYPS